jgi:hypothetical protein
MKSVKSIDVHQKAYACIHVFERSSPVLLVSRADGDWCFLCGQLHGNNGSEYRVVGIGHVLDQDQSLVAVMDLLPDWEAERTEVDGGWLRTRVALES